MQFKIPLLAIIGPSASGKSALGVELCQKIRNFGQAEVVSADSMQLYRGVDVASAKLSLPDRQGIPHYQIDVLEVDQEASVAVYQHLARKNLSQILNDKKIPFVVGGSPLYIRALLDDLIFPPTNTLIRERLEHELKKSGAESLYQRLEKIDPLSAKIIHPHNHRRLVRALEVIEITGSSYLAYLPKPTYHYEPTYQIAIDWSLDELDRRIMRRTENMFLHQGIIEEYRYLVQNYILSKTAAKTIGFAECEGVLSNKLTINEAIESTAQKTRKLVRQQLKWFRKDQRVIWLGPTSALNQANQLLEKAFS